MFLGEQFLTFQKTVMASSLGLASCCPSWNAWPQRRRHYELLKCWEMFTLWHGIAARRLRSSVLYVVTIQWIQDQVRCLHERISNDMVTCDTANSCFKIRFLLHFFKKAGLPNYIVSILLEKYFPLSKCTTHTTQFHSSFLADSWLLNFCCNFSKVNTFILIIHEF